nr:sigma-70 family RNA polymerase sigma factor [Oceanococcus sp. HetDA_MAG_MS8]
MTQASPFSADSLPLFPGVGLPRATRAKPLSKRGLFSAPASTNMARVHASTSASETPLLPQIAAGDRAAVDACLKRYGGLVWSLARRYCPSSADAEDAVQDIFIELWKSAGSYDPDVRAETVFITMIARRRLIDRHRRESKHAVLVEWPEYESAEPADPSTSSPESHAELETVRRLAAQLEPDQQKVLDLALTYGYSQSQIASKIDMPLGTVKSHMRRGLARLQTLLKTPVAGGAT